MVAQTGQLYYAGRVAMTCSLPDVVTVAVAGDDSGVRSQLSYSWLLECFQVKLQYSYHT